MKKIFAILVACCFISTACHRKPATEAAAVAETPAAESMELTFDSIAYHDHPDAEPSLSVDAVLVLPNENPSNPVSLLLRKQVVADALGEKYAVQGDAAEALRAYVGDLQKQFEESMAEMDYDPADAADGMGYMFNWESELHTTVALYCDPLLVCQTTNYNYTGGAHGYGAAEYAVYSTINGKRQQVDDVFLADAQSRAGLLKLMHSRLEQMIAKEEGYGDMDVSWDAVKPTASNFMVSADGVTFRFNQYEIAAYCYGPIDIVLTVDEIRPYLVEDGVVAAYFNQLGAKPDQLASR